MTCEHVREQLLQLPISRFGELEAHLRQCAACRHLAENIVALEGHVDRLIDNYARSDTFDAAFASASAAIRPTRPMGRWLVTSLIGLAAAASLWLVVGQPGPEPRRPDAVSAGITPEVRQDLPDLVRIGTGRSALLALDGMAEAITVVDPTVASVVTVGGPQRIQVMGLTAGRTQLVVRLANGGELTWWIAVDRDPTLYEPSEAHHVVTLPPIHLELLVAERIAVDLARPARSIQVTDRQLVAVNPAGPGKVTLDGLAAGTTDVLVQYGPDQFELYVVTVQE